MIDWRRVRLPGLDGSTVALVTGASGAIGWHTSMALASLGVRVGLMARSEPRLRELSESAPAGSRQQLLVIPGDVSSPADARRAVAAVERRWGPLDVLIHSAAIGDGQVRIDDVTTEKIDRVVSVNFTGTVLMAQAAARAMRAGNRGAIVNVGSVGASRASPRGTVYGASKAAVVRLTRQLAVELGPDGIRVNCISPGQTPTVLRTPDEAPGTPPQASGSGDVDTIPLRRRGQLDDYTAPALFLASDLARYVTGTNLLADGGVSVRR